MSGETKTVLDIVADFINAPFTRVDGILQNGKEAVIGGIRIIPMGVNHSAKGALALLIEADGRRLLYTGDFNRFGEGLYSSVGALDVLLTEGTNITVHSDKTEEEIEADMARIMRETSGQVFVLCSTTNIDRIQSVELACQKSGRTIAYDPFMKAIMDGVGSFSFKNPVGFVPRYIDREKEPRIHQYLAKDINGFNNANAVAGMNNLTFMVRQSMGPFLRRLDGIAPLTGSTLMYSIWRGYEQAPYTKSFLDLCRSLGMTIEYIHASGHAYREQLETAAARLKPAALIPIHTESAETFREFHNNVVLLHNGDKYQLL
jgi:ribonuclease J